MECWLRQCVCGPACSGTRLPVLGPAHPTSQAAVRTPCSWWELALGSKQCVLPLAQGVGIGLGFRRVVPVGVSGPLWWMQSGASCQKTCSEFLLKMYLSLCIAICCMHAGLLRKPSLELILVTLLCPLARHTWEAHRGTVLKLLLFATPSQRLGVLI